MCVCQCVFVRVGVPSSCVSEESLSSVGRSSLSLKSSEGEGTGTAAPSSPAFLSSAGDGMPSSSPSGRQSVYSSGPMSICTQANRGRQL